MGPLDLFLAAVRAVAPEALSGPANVPALASGAQLLEWVTRADPAAATIHARLTDRERADLRQVLDGMLRERATAVTAPRFAGVADTDAPCPPAH